jgi:putative N6-adenine-specific DNA methylase
MATEDDINKNESTGQLIITIKTFYGLEQVLKEELEELGYSDITILNRAVQLAGEWKDVYFMNLHLRCAVSVLVQIAKFRIKDEEDLYKKAFKIDWTQYFDNTKTFAVKGAVFSKLFRHSQYPHFLLKDAIVDKFRDLGMERPDVNVKQPQVVFDLYIQETECIVSLNTSGVPLFQRGYRESVGEAPLNEVVAAGLIRMSGWDKKTDLYDPFCGSGTILIEAAMLAANIPSNIERHHYAFKNFKNFQAEVWDEIYESANKRCASLPCKIMGSDLSQDMMLMAKRNLRGLPVGRFVEVSADDFADVKKPFETGMMITNPPYGERMGTDIPEMYEALGDWMKKEMTGCTCWIISASEEGFKSVGLRPTRKLRLYNGDLECSFRKFEIYAGSKKDRYDDDGNLKEEFKND